MGIRDHLYLFSRQLIRLIETEPPLMHLYVLKVSLNVAKQVTELIEVDSDALVGSIRFQRLDDIVCFTLHNESTFRD